MNVLIITLGNSEIQFDINKLGDCQLIESNICYENISIPVYKNTRVNQSQFLIPRYSRDGGLDIIENFDKLEKILIFPIVEPLPKFILENEIFKVIFIATDQDDINHRKGDTIHYAKIIQKYFCEVKNLKSIEYETIFIRKNLKEIDYQYETIGIELDKTIGSSKVEDKIYLFAQGGVDQINHALTLQLLYRYKQRVNIYQKAEDEELNKLEFPHLFLKDLNKQKLIKHIQDYDFGKASILFDNDKAAALAQYSNLRLNLNYNSLDDYEIDENYKINFQEGKVQEYKCKLQDLIYSYKIDLLQEQYNGALTKLFIILENIFNNFIQLHLKEKYKYKDILIKDYFIKSNRAPDSNNEKWSKFIKEEFGEDIMKKLVKENVHLNNPNEKTSFYIAKHIIGSNKLEILSTKDLKLFYTTIDKFRDLRNEINHNMGSASLKQIEAVFDKNKTSSEIFESTIDKLADTVELSKSIYGKIKDELLTQYL